MLKENLTMLRRIHGYSQEEIVKKGLEYLSAQNDETDQE